MKVKFYCDSGANIKSCNSEVIDITEEYEISDEEWNKMSEDDKYELAKEWAYNSGLEIGFEIVED